VALKSEIVENIIEDQAISTSCLILAQQNVPSKFNTQEKNANTD
jgi:hypothetical protein